MKTVMISQPMYFPWVGFMAQISMVDVLVWLDDVQFSTNSFTRRVQVINNGKCKFISIPLNIGGKFQTISTLSSNDEVWKISHRNALINSLQKRRYLHDALHLFDLSMAKSNVFETIVTSTEIPAAAMNILPSEILYSSNLGIAGHGTNRVLEIVKLLGGTHYITGHGASNYLDHVEFEKNGVAVSYMRYEPIPWEQPIDVFTPYVSVLDLIGSVSIASAAKYLNPMAINWRTHLEDQRRND